MSSQAQVEPSYTTHVQKSVPRYSAGMRAGVRVESTGIGEDLQFNPDHVKSITGILQIIEAVIGLICLISISPPRLWYSIVFTFMAAIAFAITVSTFFCYLVTMRNVIFPKFNWQITELIYTAMVAVLYLVMSIILLILSCRQLDRYYLTNRGFFDGYITAGSFGLINSLVYAAGFYFLLRPKREVTGVAQNNNINNN